MTSHVVVAALALTSFGFGALWGAVITVSLRQSLAPDRLLGRVNSAYRLVAWGTQPLGAVAGGVVAAALGLRAPFWLSTAVLGVLGFAPMPLVNNRTITRARAEVG